MGAAHSVDIPFFFNTLVTSGSERLTDSAVRRHLSDVLHGEWASFLHGEAPGWEAYSPDQRAVQCFDTATETAFSPRAEALFVWDGVC